MYCRVISSSSANSGILDKVMESDPTFRTLFLGRLKSFPELSVRLAAAAKRSPERDTRHGRPKSSKPLAQTGVNHSGAPPQSGEPGMTLHMIRD
jgi:hypothetical protein